MATKNHLFQDLLKISRSAAGLAFTAQKELGQKTYSLGKKILPRCGFVTREEMEATKTTLEKQIAELKQELETKNQNLK